MSTIIITDWQTDWLTEIQHTDPASPRAGLAENFPITLTDIQTNYNSVSQCEAQPSKHICPLGWHTLIKGFENIVISSTWSSGSHSIQSLLLLYYSTTIFSKYSPQTSQNQSLEEISTGLCVGATTIHISPIMDLDIECVIFVWLDIFYTT